MLSGDGVLRFGRDGSSDAKSRAIVEAESMRSRRKREERRPRVAVFRYKNTVYTCDPVRCGMLNERLYKDCAADEVFALTADGLAFRPSYRGYIEAVAKKGGKVYESILASERRLLSELGEIAKKEGLGMAFYVYIAEHVFNGKELPLHIKGEDGEDYAFRSVRNYASALAALVGSPKAVKVAALFSEHTCGRFFKDYERTSTELSRLIFEHTGSFVIFSDEEKAGRDMGKSFIKDRPVPCPEEGKQPLLDHFVDKFIDAHVETVDGLKVYFDDGWVLLRPSTTEALFRIYSESKVEGAARDRIAEFVSEAEVFLKDNL